MATAAGRERGWADAQAAAPYQFLTNPADFVAALRYQAARSAEIFQRFEQIMGSRDRFHGIICGWGIDDLSTATAIAEDLLDWQDAHRWADAYAIAPYFGFMLNVGRTVQDVVAARELELMTYEAGHHMVRATEVPYPNDEVKAKADLVHTDERMYDIYAEYLAGWFEFGDSMNLFSDVLALGNFGLASRWDQSPIYPKYRAVHDFLQTTAPGDSGFVAPGTVTDPEPVAIPSGGDDDGDVDVDDFFAFANAFGSEGGIFDLDGNGTVDVDDFFAFANVFGTGVR